MNIDEILNEWKSGEPLRRETINAAVALREEIVPHLIRILEEVTANPDDPGRCETDDSHICALFLLAHFREPAACRSVANFCRMAPAALDSLLGDMLTETLPRLLAAVCGGDTAPIRELIEDRSADEYARGSAMGALRILALEGVLSREEVMGYFKELFNSRLEREKGATVRAELVCEAVDLYPGEVEEEIREAYREDLLDDSYIGLAEVEEVLEAGMEFCLARTRRNHKPLVFDIPDEIVEWQQYLFGEAPDDYDFEDDIGSDRPVTVLDELRYHRSEPYQPQVPYRHEGIKIGPNDPCPCGSGKKHKKCCGRMA